MNKTESGSINQMSQAIGSLQADVRNINERVTHLSKQMETVQDILARNEGGWKMLATIAGASAAIGGLIVKIAPWAGSLLR